jgi:hypothetical protein
MAGTDLIRVAGERQVRSYHRAFMWELTLHSLNKSGDLRLWRPIPARGIFWGATFEILALLITHALAVSIPFGAPSWIMVYGILPISLAYVCTSARIEGRRLHVVLSAWLAHAYYGSHLCGGYQRAAKTRPLGPSRINVQTAYAPPRPFPGRRYIIATIPLLVLALTLAIVIGNRGRAARPVSSVILPLPTIRFPLAAIARPRPRTHVFAPRAKRPAPRRSPAPTHAALPAHVAPPSPIPVTPAPTHKAAVRTAAISSPAPPAVVVPPAAPPAVVTPPAVVATYPTAPSVTPHVNPPVAPHVNPPVDPPVAPRPICYPGVLGC